jgi:hypothetical protein
MLASFRRVLEEVAVMLARLEVSILRLGGDPARLDDLAALRLRLVEIDGAVAGGARSPEAAMLEVADLAAESRRRFGSNPEAAKARAKGGRLTPAPSDRLLS